MDRFHRPIGVAGSVALLVAAFGGCMTSTPTLADWRSSPAQSLEEVASEVATAELVVDEFGRGRLMSSTARVILVQSEEAAGMAAESLASIQPPVSVRERDREVSDALERAVDLVRKARVAAVDQDESQYGPVEEALATVHEELTALAVELRQE